MAAWVEAPDREAFFSDVERWVNEVPVERQDHSRAQLTQVRMLFQRRRRLRTVRALEITGRET